MSGFEIGHIGERFRDGVRITLEDDGVGIWVNGEFGLGGYTRLTPAQSREVGELFIKAAENWELLSATKVKFEAEEIELGRRKRSLIHRTLFGEFS